MDSKIHDALVTLIDSATEDKGFEANQKQFLKNNMRSELFRIWAYYSSIQAGENNSLTIKLPDDGTTQKEV